MQHSHSSQMQKIKGNISAIHEKIQAYSAQCGREASSIELIAVSKTRRISEIRAAYHCGIRKFAENKLQELEEKFSPLPYSDIEVHFIGHLQSNKVKKTVKIADWIQSVDSVKILQLINKEAEKLAKTINICIQVNTSAEAAQFGLRSKQAIFELLHESARTTSVHVRGLMTIAPLRKQGEEALRKAFVSLRELFRECSEKFSLESWDTLSMGMSGDYDIAIEEGATHIRLGTSIFGQRIL